MVSDLRPKSGAFQNSQEIVKRSESLEPLGGKLKFVDDNNLGH